MDRDDNWYGTHFGRIHYGLFETGHILKKVVKNPIRQSLTVVLYKTHRFDYCIPIITNKLFEMGYKVKLFKPVMERKDELHIELDYDESEERPKCRT